MQELLYVTRTCEINS